MFSKRLDSIGTLLGGSLLERAVPIQRDWATHRRIRAEAFVPMLDIQLVVENTPPKYDSFPSQIWVDFVIDTGHRHPGVTADFAPFGLTRERAEAFPTADGSYPGGRQILKPVFHALWGQMLRREAAARKPKLI